MADAAVLRAPRRPGGHSARGQGPCRPGTTNRHILHGVDLDVREGEVVDPARPQRRRQVDHAEVDHGHRRQAHRLGRVRRRARLIKLPIERIARLGVALCPEERAIFASLTVKENLFLPPAITRTGADERGASTIPNLRERLSSGGGKLSGRRAADAGDRADPAHRRALPDARRADRRPRPRHHPADRPHASPNSSARASPSSWSSRTSASLRRSPTASSSWSTAASSTPSPAPSSRDAWRCCTRRWGWMTGMPRACPHPAASRLPSPRGRGDVRAERPSPPGGRWPRKRAG